MFINKLFRVKALLVLKIYSQTLKHANLYSDEDFNDLTGAYASPTLMSLLLITSCWRRMQKFSGTDRVNNVVLQSQGRKEHSS